MNRCDTILSIVIVEYHSIPEVRTCIGSLKEHIHVSCEIIVSSNSCYTQDQISDISQNDESVKWLFNKKNGGFAYAMNEGLKVACGKYLIIMNSDCIIESSIDSMIEFMDNHPDVGAVGPLMLDKKGNIQDTARPYVNVPRYILRQIRRVIGHKTSVLSTWMDYNMIQTVDWVIGAFIMVSRYAYELTGGLDDNYFMYAEDLDWCTRIRQRGLEVVFYPRTIIRYKGSRRARNKSSYARIFIKSHIRFWKKFGFFYGYPKRKHVTY